MSYHHTIHFRVSDPMRVDLERLAAERHTDVAKLLRSIVAHELANPHDRTTELYERVLFLVIAMDGLLAEHGNRELRTQILTAWEKRLIEEARHEA